MEKHIIQPALYHAIRLIGIMGLNPFNQTFSTKVLMVYSLLTAVVVTVLNLIGIIAKWKGVETVDDLVFVPGTAMVVAKCSCLLFNNQNLHKIVTNMNQAWPLDKFGSEIENELLKPHRLVFKIFISYAVIAYVTCSLMCAPAFLSEEPVLIFPSYEICDFHEMICFGSIYLWQCISLLTGFTVTSIAFETIFLSLACHAYVGLENVKIGFYKMVSTEEREHKENMRELINQHNYVLSLIEDIKNFYSKLLLFEFWGNLVSMIFSLYMLTADSPTPFMDRLSRYGLLYGFWVMQLCAYCITGTILSEQSTSIYNVAYNVDWLSKHDNELRNALSMVIIRSQKAATISIGGMNHLNLEAFVEVMRTSISVCTLLKKLSGTSDA